MANNSCLHQLYSTARTSGQNKLYKRSDAGKDLLSWNPAEGVFFEGGSLLLWNRSKHILYKQSRKLLGYRAFTGLIRKLDKGSVVLQNLFNVSVYVMIYSCRTESPIYYPEGMELYGCNNCICFFNIVSLSEVCLLHLYFIKQVQGDLTFLQYVQSIAENIIVIFYFIQCKNM